MLPAPSFHFLAQHHAEIGGKPGGLIQLAVHTYIIRYALERIGSWPVNIAAAFHLVYYNISPVKRLLWVTARVIQAGRINHAYKHSGFLHIYAVRLLLKKRFCRVAYAKNIIAKGNGVKINSYYFIFGKIAFQLYRYNSFFYFLNTAQ